MNIQFEPLMWLTAKSAIICILLFLGFFIKMVWEIFSSHKKRESVEELCVQARTAVTTEKPFPDMPNELVAPAPTAPAQKRPIYGHDWPALCLLGRILGIFPKSENIRGPPIITRFNGGRK